MSSLTLVNLLFCLTHTTHFSSILMPVSSTTTTSPKLLIKSYSPLSAAYLAHHYAQNLSSPAPTFSLTSCFTNSNPSSLFPYLPRALQVFPFYITLSVPKIDSSIKIFARYSFTTDLTK